MEQISEEIDKIEDFKNKKKRKFSKEIINNIFARDKLIIRLIFVTCCILVAYFVYYFIVWNIVVSMTDWQGLIQTNNFVGFENYLRMLDDPIFWTSLTNNLVFMLVFIPSSIVIGLFLAILLDQKIRKESVFRTIYLLPYALSFIVTAYLWQWMFIEDGVINFILDLFGLGSLKMAWISDPDIALFSVSFALVWQFSGYIMLIFLAAIRTVPQSHIMAAQIDGASGIRLYTRVIIPQIKTSTFTAFVILMIFSLKAFDFIWILTDGGPGWATTILPITVFKLAFKSNQFAYSSAIATTLFLIVMVIVIPYLYITYRKR
ncbi:MAG TPA: sugar ABC transporter permease [Candidatus Nanopelagicaceae bacterium]|nr:sugar ABC transporter permease [Candidatus Nanopelagicaceae bacterium]